MIITTRILFDGKYKNWEFKVNENGYIETKIDGLFSDTLYDMGIIKDVNHLKNVVIHLLSCWKVKYKDLRSWIV